MERSMIDFITEDNGLPMRGKLAFAANFLYSKIYIALTGTDKFYFREHSLIHKLLVCLY